MPRCKNHIFYSKLFWFSLATIASLSFHVDMTSASSASPFSSAAQLSSSSSSTTSLHTHTLTDNIS